MKIAMSVLLLELMSLLGLPMNSVLANEDPDYQIEVQQNTTCSFINANNVNVRQEPNTKSSVVAVLNRGDVVRTTGRDKSWVSIAARDSGKAPTPYTPLQGWVSNQYINGCSESQFDRWRK